MTCFICGGTGAVDRQTCYACNGSGAIGTAGEQRDLATERYAVMAPATERVIVVWCDGSETHVYPSARPEGK